MIRFASRAVPLLLALALLASLPGTIGALRAADRRERVATARVVLDSIGATIAHARAFGVPEDGLVGLDDLVAARLPASSGVVALRLEDARGRVAWQRGGPAPALSIPLVSPAGEGTQLVGVFEPPPGSRTRIAAAAAVLVAVAAALALVLHELARFLDLRREGFLRHFLARQLDALCAGDLRAVWRPAGLRDPRLAFLRDQVLLLGEQHRRVVRLVESLRRTEPDAGARAAIADCLAEVDRRYRFGERVADHRVWPEAGTARCFAVLALVFAGLPLAPASTTAAGAAAAAAAWALGLAGARAGSACSWPLRLVIAFGAAALANVLASFDTAWVSVAAALCSGASSGLAFDGGLAAGRSREGRGARARRLLLAALAGALLGPALALACPAWSLRGVALLAVLSAAALLHCVPDTVRAPAVRTERFDWRTTLAGAAATTAALVVMLLAGATADTLVLALAACAASLLPWHSAGARRAVAAALAAFALAALFVPALREAHAALFVAAGAAGCAAPLRRVHLFAPRQLLIGVAGGAFAAAMAAAVAAHALSPEGARCWLLAQLALLLAAALAAAPRRAR